MVVCLSVSALQQTGDLSRDGWMGNNQSSSWQLVTTTVKQRKYKTFFFQLKIHEDSRLVNLRNAERLPLRQPGKINDVFGILKESKRHQNIFTSSLVFKKSEKYEKEKCKRSFSVYLMTGLPYCTIRLWASKHFALQCWRLDRLLRRYYTWRTEA